MVASCPELVRTSKGHALLIKPLPLFKRYASINSYCKLGHLLQSKHESDMNGTVRSNIKAGVRVKIILKKDQRSGVLTEGIVKDILTSSPSHHHGIKVRLEDGQVGRVKEILN